MATQTQTPQFEIPAGYREVVHLVVTEGKRILILNLLSLVPLVIALLGMAAWWQVVVHLRGTNPGSDVPWWLSIIILVIVVIPIHEGLHGLAILLTGHKPRFGAKLDKGVVYATADGALFRRNDFIMIALAPIVVMTLVGMGLMIVLPDGLANLVSLGIVFNAASAIGDLWMTWVVLRYPSSALVKDEEDGIRVFTRA